MKRWSKQRRFFEWISGRRFKRRREMSPQWQKRMQRYMRAAGMVGGLLFRRVDLSENQVLIGVSRRTPKPKTGLWFPRTAPRRHVRGKWVEVRA